MIGGVIGTIVLEKVGSFLYQSENEEKKKVEESLRKEPPPMVMARRAVNLLDLNLSDQGRSWLAKIIHWGTGIIFGGFYGLLHDRAPFVSKAAGLPYAIVFSLIVDEGLNTALKVTPPPQEFPIEAHVRGLAAHVAYTAALHHVFQFLKTKATR
jgi:uncharacterized membrane protein YagU involved in acid resistance